PYRGEQRAVWLLGAHADTAERLQRRPQFPLPFLCWIMRLSRRRRLCRIDRRCVRKWDLYNGVHSLSDSYPSPDSDPIALIVIRSSDTGSARLPSRAAPTMTYRKVESWPCALAFVDGAFCSDNCTQPAVSSAIP